MPALHRIPKIGFLIFGVLTLADCSSSTSISDRRSASSAAADLISGAQNAQPGGSSAAKTASGTAAGTSTGANASGGSSSGTTPAVNSVQEFQSTVYPLTTQWCVVCHASVQTPFIAAPDVNNAYSAVVVNQKVDLTDPAQSRLVLRLTTDNHNCPTIGCAAAGAQMLAAVTSWANAVQSALPATAQMPTTGTLTFADAQPPASTTTNPAGVQAYAASMFTLKAPFVFGTDPATNAPVFNSPSTATSDTNGTAAPTDLALGTAILEFNVNAAGTYVIEGLVNGPTATSASFYLNVDAAVGYMPWEFTSNAANYTWNTAAATPGGTPYTFALTAGQHAIEVIQRQAGAQLEGILVSSVQGYNPAKTPPALQSPEVLTFDISSLVNLPGASVSVQIDDTYSPNAYLFKGLSINVPSGSIAVQNVCILINGTCVAQNSTFTVVDATVAAPGGPLSTAAMVAVRQQGVSTDKFSIQFGSISTK